MSAKPHREKAVVTQPPTRRKNRVQADKDNTLKGVAERLKSVKPHVTKKQFVTEPLTRRKKQSAVRVRIIL